MLVSPFDPSPTPRSNFHSPPFYPLIPSLLAPFVSSNRGSDFLPTDPKVTLRWLDSQPRKEGNGSVDVIVADYFAWAKENKGSMDVLLDYT